MRESHLETYFIEKVRAVGGLTIKLVPLNRGIPDRLVILPGGHIHLVELKVPEGRLSAAQKLWHARAKRLGAPVAVLWDRAEISAWIRERFAELDPQDPKPGPRPRPRCRACGSTLDHP